MGFESFSDSREERVDDPKLAEEIAHEAKKDVEAKKFGLFKKSEEEQTEAIEKAQEEVMGSQTVSEANNEYYAKQVSLEQGREQGSESLQDMEKNYIQSLGEVQYLKNRKSEDYRKLTEDNYRYLRGPGAKQDAERELDQRWKGVIDRAQAEAEKWAAKLMAKGQDPRDLESQNYWKIQQAGERKESYL